MAHVSRRKPARPLRRAAGLVAAALSLTLLTGVLTGAPAGAWSWNDDGRIVKEDVWSEAMQREIPVSIMPGGQGSNALYLLDGLRARDDFNGWDMETDAFDKFRDDNVTVVMPIGGESSWYADWDNPSGTNGQDHTYKWETFLRDELPRYMNDRYGVPYQGNAIAGLSMGGSAAMYMAAKSKPYYSFAGSFSGYLHNSMVGMPAGISLGMLDAGSFNAHDMYGSLIAPGWAEHDPFVFAPDLRDLSLYVSAGSALPDPDPDFGDHPESLIDYYNELNGMGLEALALLNTKIFQMQLDSLGIPATYDFPPVGLHGWNQWTQQLDNARPQILDALGG